jgi:hypothetical protein
MTRELICNDCGQNLGDPIQSNITNHIMATGHKNIKEREALLSDGTLASNPGTFPDGSKIGDTKTQTETPKETPNKELEELKATLPTKAEQKEIEKLAEEKEDSGKKKYKKRYY